AQIKGDHLELSVDKKWTNDSNPDWNPAYSGGEFRTNEFYGYGYYETSMQAIKNDGVVSSFFTYTGPSDDNPWDEIDIEVLGKDTTKVQLNYYTNGTGNHEKMIDLGFDASEGYHTYGFDWQPGKITWYIDGKKVHEATQNIPVTPGKIMMNAWPGKTVDDWLKAFNGKTPLTARYQWVTYKKSGNSQNPNQGQNQNPNQGQNQNPNQGQNQNPNQGQSQGGKGTFNASATMVSDFRTGKAGDFFASDGWTNGKPFDCWWYKQNAVINGNHLELKIDKKYGNDSNPDWNPQYSGGEFRTNNFYGYGYYETSMKAIKNDGVVSSFFTYTGPSDNNPWDEIDVEVLGKDTTKVQFNYYTNGKGDHEYMYDLGFDASQGYHTYGFDWQPGKITWYVDGKKAYEATQNIPTTPGKIMMNAWPGKTVDDWLKAFNGKTPLTAYYEWVTYNK
ncbi:MAG: family 16 glycosylhydrolase, partial [Erysipelotrichaceae bacterium]|nr:family 16 glycosylhydrolase [Erysipelotrichaceae bacterium]